MDSLRGLATLLSDRVQNNVKAGLTNMTPEKWIRIIIVAGAYALLRPYIIKLGAKSQMKAHERQEAEDEAAAAAAITPNQLRGQVDIPDDSDDEDVEALLAGKKGEVAAAVTATEWGKKARRRQRDVIKKLLDAEEERLRQLHEDEEDKDIEEFLVKE